MRKVWTGFLAMILIAGTVFLLNGNASKVYSADTGVEILDIDGIDYKVEKHTDINQYRKSGALTAPEYSKSDEADRWIFAGWYRDQACETALGFRIVGNGTTGVPTGTYYAKYVPADVLSVRCQISANTTEYSTSTVLRAVSSVDSLKYGGIGLELVTPEPDSKTKAMTGNTVNTRIKGANNIEEFSYSPKVMDTESEYFFSARETIPQENFEKPYLIKPHWTTKDGTKVYGVSRYVTVSQGYADNKVIYIPVKMDEQPTVTTGYTTDYSDATVKYVGYDGAYAQFEVTVPSRVTELNSATKFVIEQDSAEITEYIYRNLGSSITNTPNDYPTGDKTWYETYVKDDATEDEFVIATNADLYGLAELVNGEVDNFINKTIYLVSDIEINKGYADPVQLEWDQTLAADGKTQINNGTTNKWRKIGISSSVFAGTFDGQMHSISGVYVNGGNSGTQGLFRATASTAKVKNLRLLNSFVQTNGNEIGSIVGKAEGEFDTIYSNAVVVSQGNTVGGMIGRTEETSGVNMTNCWFDGKVANLDSDQYYGGLIGYVYKSSVINNCLNTGTISCKASEAAYVGGLVGYTEDALTLSHCLNKGTVGYENNATNYGLLVGKQKEKGNVNMSATYSTTQTGVSLVYGVGNASYSPCADVGPENGITGAIPLTSMRDLFLTETDYGYKCYWAIASHKGPVLSTFASYYEIDEQTAQVVDTSWYDLRTATYTLSDMADFYGFALLSKLADMNGFASKTVKLSANVTTKNKGTAGEWASEAPHYEWIGIGDSENAFAGTFDGGMYTINGIYLDTTDEQDGLFRNTAVGSKIQKFKLTNSYFYSTAKNFGSIAGQHRGALDTVYSDAVVVSNCSGDEASVGGLVGFFGDSDNVKTSMNNCWFNGTVTNESTTATRTGGLAGAVSVQTLDITNCLNTGIIDVSQCEQALTCAAGLVGTNLQGTLTMKNCMHNAKVIDDEQLAYAILGDSGTKSGSTTTQGTLKLEAVYYGGHGRSYRVTGATNGNFDGAGTGTYRPVNNINADFSSLYNTNKWVDVTYTTPVLKDFESVMVDTSWYNASQNTYVLYDRADLYGFVKLSRDKAYNGFAGKTVTLGTDIVVNAGNTAELGSDPEHKELIYYWTPIGTGGDDGIPFAGNFDGDKHTISGLYLNTSNRYGGLFAKTYVGSTVQNLKLTNSYFNVQGLNCGSIAGVGQGTFYNIYSDATVISSKSHVGGLVGLANSSDVVIEKCWFDGSVENTGDASPHTGGLVGRVTVGKLTIKDCLNSATVTSAYSTQKESGSDEIIMQIAPGVGGLVGSVVPIGEDDDAIEQSEENSDTSQPEDNSDAPQLIVTGCLNVGSIVHYIIPDDTLDVIIRGYGPIVGYRDQYATATIGSTYATKESCVETDRSNLTTSFTQVLEANIKGDAAQTNMPNLKWTVWKCVEGKFPEIDF